MRGKENLKVGDPEDLGVGQAHGAEGEVWSSDSREQATQGSGWALEQNRPPQAAVPPAGLPQSKLCFRDAICPLRKTV